MQPNLHGWVSLRIYSQMSSISECQPPGDHQGQVSLILLSGSLGSGRRSVLQTGRPYLGEVLFPQAPPSTLRSCPAFPTATLRDPTSPLWETVTNSQNKESFSRHKNRGRGRIRAFNRQAGHEGIRRSGPKVSDRPYLSSSVHKGACPGATYRPNFLLGRP